MSVNSSKTLLNPMQKHQRKHKWREVIFKNHMKSPGCGSPVQTGLKKHSETMCTITCSNLSMYVLYLWAKMKPEQ